MKRKILLVLWVAAGLLLLCACGQTRTLTQQLNGSAIILSQAKLSSDAPSPSPSASPSAGEARQPTLFPMPTPTPLREYNYILFPMPTPTAVPSETPTPTPTPSPSPSPTAVPLPTAPPLPNYAPIPQSVPFALSTPSPEPEAEEAPSQPESAPEAPAAPAATEPPASSKPSATASSGQDVADFAMQYVGYTYVYGAESPEEGFDCSGLVYYVYSQFGYTLNRTASAQSTDGEHVEHSDIQPGDVLCFYTSGKYIGHSGIYLGGGNYIHAQGTGYGVVVSPLSERGENYEARRILS